MVVQEAVAWVFLGRALRGRIAVDTRTDLWRFMAHARATVDLRPGRLVARECVESLRFATPIVAPAGTVGAELAEAGGGRTYRSLVELFEQLAELADPGRRAELGGQGQLVAEAGYGDAGAFTSRVAAALSRVRRIDPGSPSLTLLVPEWAGRPVRDADPAATRRAGPGLEVSDEEASEGLLYHWPMDGPRGGAAAARRGPVGRPDHRARASGSRASGSRALRRGADGLHP